MNIKINAKKFTLTEALQQYARRRINFSLSNKSDHITQVNMRLSDINGPRGGNDKRCHLLIQLKSMDNVVVEDIQADMYTAVDRACDRAARTVVRKIGRRQTLQRGIRQTVFPDMDNEVFV